MSKRAIDTSVDDDDLNRNRPTRGDNSGNNNGADRAHTEGMNDNNLQETLLNSELRDNIPQIVAQSNELASCSNEINLSSNSNQGTDNTQMAAFKTSMMKTVSEATQNTGSVNINIFPQFVDQSQRFYDHRQWHNNKTKIKKSSDFAASGGDLFSSRSQPSVENGNKASIDIQPGVSTNGLHVALNSKNMECGTKVTSTTTDIPLRKRKKSKDQYRRVKCHKKSSKSAARPSQIKEIKDVEKEAIKRVLKEQDICREDDLQLQVNNVLKANIPERHPKYLEFAFYQGGSSLKDEKYRPSNTNTELGESKEMNFDDILEQRHKNRFLCLVGYPGSGKSTCSKRLAKSKKYKCFLRKFMYMNYTEKLTLRELLLDNVYPNLDEETCERAFQWMQNNQEKCVFIFDGLDQAEWNLLDERKATKEKYSNSQSVQNLVTNLCNKHYFPKSSVIFTSRPHSLTSVPEHARPDATLYIANFSHDDAKELFLAYAGTEGEILWNNLVTSAPHLISLTYNPLMCQLVVAAVTNPSKAVGKILTMTRVFATVLENLRHCNLTKYNDINELTEQISRLAYNATSSSTVVISHDHLTKEGLDARTVQDIIILLLARKGVTGKIFDGDTKLFFSHQTFQEYYSAFYIKNLMSVQDFQKFADEKLLKDYWRVVRRFLYGLIVDLESEKPESEQNENNNIDQLEVKRKTPSVKNETSASVLEQFPNELTTPLHTFRSNENNKTDVYSSNNQQDNISKKKKILVECLIQNLQRFSAKVGRREKREVLSLWEDVFECRSLHLSMHAAKNFPTFARFSEIPLEQHVILALCDILKHVTKHVEFFYLDNCRIDSSSFHQLCLTLIDSEIIIGELYINDNIVDIDDIIRILPKIRDELCIRYCFFDKDERKKRDSNKKEQDLIQNALNNLVNSSLEVFVGYENGNHVYLQRQPQ